MDINYKELFEKYIQTFEYDKEFYFHYFLTFNEKITYGKYEEFKSWINENKDVVDEILLKNKDIIEENKAKAKVDFEYYRKNLKPAYPTLENMTTWVSFFDETTHDGK
jgi:hypothetical protein